VVATKPNMISALVRGITLFIFLEPRIKEFHSGQKTVTPS